LYIGSPDAKTETTPSKWGGEATKFPTDHADIEEAAGTLQNILLIKVRAGHLGE
jgi:hypothetical protein